MWTTRGNMNSQALCEPVVQIKVKQSASGQAEELGIETHELIKVGIEFVRHSTAGNHMHAASIFRNAK